MSEAPIAEVLVGLVSYVSGLLTAWIRRQVKR